MENEEKAINLDRVTRFQVGGLSPCRGFLPRTQGAFQTVTRFAAVSPLANLMLFRERMLKIKLETKIRVNGKEYSSPDQLPPEARAAYERALSGGGQTPQPGVSTRVVFNGQEINSPAELPPNEKKLYDDLIDVMKQGGQVETTSPGIGTVETGWLTKAQRQAVLVAAALLAGMLAFILLRLVK